MNDKLKNTLDTFDFSELNEKIIANLGRIASDSNNIKSVVPAAKLIFQLQGWGNKNKEKPLKIEIPVIEWVK